MRDSAQDMPRSKGCRFKWNHEFDDPLRLRDVAGLMRSSVVCRSHSHFAGTGSGFCWNISRRYGERKCDDKKPSPLLPQVSSH